MLNIGVLISCFNRAETTLSCLRHLFDQSCEYGYNQVVFLVDDNSTDGTSEKVSLAFPSVRIFQGNGHLFWGGAMYKAWNEAIISGTKFDYFLWINDDTTIFKYALNDLLSVAKDLKDKAIVCGVLCDVETMSRTTYSGHVNYKNPKLITPNGNIQSCDFCNGNLLLIPTEISERIGIIDPFFRHYLGDFQYSARVIKGGYKCVITPRYIGTSNFNTNHARYKCFSKQIPLIERFKLLYSPKGINPFREFKFFKIFSLSYAIWIFADLHLMTLLPRTYKRIKHFIWIEN